MRAIESAMATKSKSHSCHLLPNDRVLTFLRSSSFPKPKTWDLAYPSDLNIRFVSVWGPSGMASERLLGKAFFP